MNRHVKSYLESVKSSNDIDKESTISLEKSSEFEPHFLNLKQPLYQDQKNFKLNFEHDGLNINLSPKYSLSFVDETPDIMSFYPCYHDVNISEPVYV